MWKVKKFKTEVEARAFMVGKIAQLLFIHNGFAVEYKPLRKM